MDAFMTAILGAKEVKATARIKMPSGEVRSVSLHAIPTDASEAAFADAARQGVDLAVRVRGEDDRVRTLSGKNVFGAAAVSATCSVLGYAPTAEQERAKGRKPKDTGTAPDTKAKDTSVEPSIG